MKILQPHDQSGWIACVIDGHLVHAKVYDEPSAFGVGGFGRVSKLAILKESFHDTTKNFSEQCCYSYDRGLDFDEAPPGLVSKVVEELEKLPKACS